jgi:putative oxidoreductase
MKKKYDTMVLPAGKNFSALLINKKGVIIESVSALFILLFAYTGITKLAVIKDLLKVLKKYPLIGQFYELVAWGLPITELAVVLLLIIPRTRIAGLIASIGLMSVFTIYLSYMLIYAPKLPCTCGGMLQQLTWPQHLVFNIVFILLGVAAYWLSRTNRPKI